MNRRQFLRGTLLSVAGTEAIVRLASSAESSALMAHREIIVGHPEPAQYFMGDSPEVYLRRNDGDFVCIGIMTQLQMSVNTVDVSQTTWKGEAILIPGMRRGQLFFEGKK